MNHLVRVAQLVVVFAVLSLVADAQASTGILRGHWDLRNENGNYCDWSAQDCTGAAYDASEFNAPLPFRNAHVEVWIGSAPIGQGTTDDNGNYKMRWTSDTLDGAYVRVFAQNGELRWSINNTKGQRTNTKTPTFTLTPGTTSGNSQFVGSFVDSSSQAGEVWYNNLFWASTLEWNLSFSLVGALQIAWTGVEVRGLSTSIAGFAGDPARCLTSCADGPTKHILIDSFQSAFQPQGRMMHEAGHVASYVLNPFHRAVNYCWDQNGSTQPVPPNTSCNWSFTTPEWAASAFEEAFASFCADSTLWYPNAVDPTSCISGANCLPNSSPLHIEESHYPFNTNNCDVTAVTPEKRWPISALRTLWDIYDDHDDADGDSVAEGPAAYWRLYANMQNFPAGVADHQIDEPWFDTNFNSIDSYDGRGMSDYAYWYNRIYTSVGTLSVDNCSPL